MSCLDVFAGSGALGFEAASRHASRVVMLESDKVAVTMLNQNRDLLKATQVEIIQADSLPWMRQCREGFDLVLLDPPFAGKLMDRALPLAESLLNPDGWLYVEQAEPIEEPEGFIIHRQGTAGMSRFALLKRG